MSRKTRICCAGGFGRAAPGARCVCVSVCVCVCVCVWQGGPHLELSVCVRARARACVRAFVGKEGRTWSWVTSGGMPPLSRTCTSRSPSASAMLHPPHLVAAVGDTGACVYVARALALMRPYESMVCASM
jgi:hypothetical protein